MGVNNLHDVQVGQDADPNDLNQYRQALSGDLAPRDSDGRVVAAGADVGQQAIPFRNGYFEALFINGNPVGAGGDSTGGGTTGIALRNGVVRGRAPNDRDNYPGWMVQAGAAGVTLLADADNPLEVKLDGVSYQLVADTTGGTPLPSALNVSCQFVPLGRGNMYPCGGGEFSYGSNNIPVENGDVFCFRFDLAGGGREYLLAFRGSADTMAVLGTRGVINTSPNDLAVAFGGDMSDPQPAVAIRCGHVFVDPTTATWTLGIERRITGAVASELPPDNNAIGDMIYREFDQRWYRWGGSDWLQTSRVYLGIAAIDGSSVVGVAPVRGETALRALIAEWNNSGAPLAEMAIGDHAHFFSTNAQRDVEQKTGAALLGQAHEAYHPDYTIEKPDADGIYGAYLDINTHTAFGEAELAPMWMDTGENGGRVVLIHPHRHAIFIGSFSVDEGNLYAGRVQFAEGALVPGSGSPGLIASFTDDILCPFMLRVGRTELEFTRGNTPSGDPTNAIGGLDDLASTDAANALFCDGQNEQGKDDALLPRTIPVFSSAPDDIIQLIQPFILGEIFGIHAWCSSNGSPSGTAQSRSYIWALGRQDTAILDTFLQTQNLR